MPSTVYKGDLAEVTFGHETGLVLLHDNPKHLQMTSSAGSTTDTTDIEFGRIAATNPEVIFDAATTGELKYPKNLLVGCKLRIKSPTTWATDDYEATGRIFTIVENGGNTITITPQMKTHAASAADDTIIIDAYCTPSVDVTNTDYDAQADNSKESVLTDQFIGLAGTVALPETKVDVKRYHIVGVGRDVAVQAPGKFTNEGGSMELMLNSPRWLYYCLGGETVTAPNAVVGWNAADAAQTVGLSTSIAMGDPYLDVDVAVNALYLDAGGGAAADLLKVGDYVVIEDTDAGSGTTGDYLIPVVQHKEVDLDAVPTNYFGKAGGDNHADFYESTVRSETRRITAIDATNNRLFVDDPFTFAHDSTAAGQQVKFIRFHSDGTKYGSPHMDTSAPGYGVITNPVSRLLFTRWHLPSFAIETSIRNRDVGSFNVENTDPLASNAPGGAFDSKQLTRIYKGCKVLDWAMSADTDAALKLTVNFGSAMCYTDTGRLESNAGDRFTAHRMFENTANSPTARKEAGIAERSQKPFFFYNGNVHVGGKAIAQITNFNLSGTTGTTFHHVIRTSTVAETYTANGQIASQIPYGASRNATMAVEGKETFDLGIDVIVDDPIFWHQMRGAQDFFGTGNEIRMDFEKQGVGGTKERMTLVIDDYYITEAPLPIPEDKGVIRSALKIVPKTVRIISTDTLIHC